MKCLLKSPHSQPIKLSAETIQAAADNNFEVKAFKFEARKEDLRKPRIVRVAAIQNQMVVSTSESIHVQRDALYARITTIIKAAAASNVNVLCMQEVWSKFINWFHKY